MRIPKKPKKPTPVLALFLDYPLTNVPGFHIKTADGLGGGLAVCAVDCCVGEPVGQHPERPRHRYAKECAERIVRTWNAHEALVEALEAYDQLLTALSAEMNWGQSALSADTIVKLNEMPAKGRAALALARKEAA